MDIHFGPPDLPENLPGTPLQQSATYGAVLRSFGCATAVADIRSDGVLLGRARIHLRRIGPLRVAWLPCGSVWTEAATPAMQHTALAALPRAALNGNWRNHLNQAERAGLTITTRPLDLSRDMGLLARETTQRKTRRYAALPHAFNQRWAALAPQDSLMLIASCGGQALAFTLMLLHAPTATYHVGWTGAEGRRRGAHTLLLWQASVALAARGYQRLDLGICDRVRTPELATFKLGTGARPQMSGPTRLRL